MSEEMVVKYCSPTLAGLKTGSMFSAAFSDYDDMKNSLRRLNNILTKKGLRVIPLRLKNNTALIYVYRPSSLACDLKNSLAEDLLTDRGYKCGNCSKCITHLMKRLSENEEFPHEIGLFLGYPPTDVYGFIYNKDKSYKCVGNWKVYSNFEETLKKFEDFKKCTSDYLNHFSIHGSIEELITV